MHEIMNSKKVSTISNFSRLVDGLLELDILIAEGGTAPIKIPKWCTCVLVSQEVGQIPQSVVESYCTFSSCHASSSKVGSPPWDHQPSRKSYLPRVHKYVWWETTLWRTYLPPSTQPSQTFISQGEIVRASPLYTMYLR